MTTKLKILVIGPPQCGKTEIANNLCQETKSLLGNAMPTIGCRIQELELTLKINELQTSVTIELWDVSGDEKYSMIWPAIKKDADGILIVYKSCEKKQAQSLDRYCKAFGNDMTSGQCMVVAHKFGQEESKIAKPKLSNNFEIAKIVIINVADDITEFIEQFQNFCQILYNIKLRKIESYEKMAVDISPMSSAILTKFSIKDQNEDNKFTSKDDT